MSEKDKTRARTYNLRRLYGITPEQYDELLQKQQGCCAICDKHESEFPTRLAVDHDHISGVIRGLLCRYCNHRVVGRHRDPQLLRKVADYVERDTGWLVPPKKKRRKKRPRKEPNG